MGGREEFGQRGGGFVEGLADDDAGEVDATEAGEGLDVGGAGDAAGCDDGDRGDGVRHFGHGGEVRALKHAIGGGVRVDDRGDAATGDVGGEVCRARGGGLDPTLDLDEAAARVDADGDGGAVARGEAADGLGIGDGASAENDAVGAGVENLAHVVVGAQAAADFEGDGDGLGDAGDHGRVGGLAGEGAVEIDDVEVLRAEGLPAQGHFNGVGGVDGGVIHPPLAEPDALAVLQVDGRKDFHVKFVPYPPPILQAASH